MLDDLRRIVQALRESSRTAEQTLGVSGAQLFVLHALAGAGPLSLNALAERTHTHQSTVSVVVKRLVKRGLVDRAVSRSDARRIELNLTSTGRALLRRAPGAAQERLLEGLRRMSAAQRGELAVALRRLVVAMGLAARKPEMFFEDRKRRRGKPVRQSLAVANA